MGEIWERIWVKYGKEIMGGVWQRYGQNIGGAVWVKYCWNMGEKWVEYGLDGVWVV